MFDIFLQIFVLNIIDNFGSHTHHITCDHENKHDIILVMILSFVSYTIWIS